MEKDFVFVIEPSNDVCTRLFLYSVRENIEILGIIEGRWW